MGLMPVAAVVAGAAIVKLGVDSVKAFQEAQQVAAQTTAVLKSTGGQANVTADDVGKLANSIRDYSGVDDDAVQSAENMLLSFREVHNEVGKGNDIFNQATVAATDMATFLNHGAVPSLEQVTGAAKQLGKALNDPSTGMTALRKSGVSFNASQVELIKSLQESGDLMGAQKIILGELSKEFGGAAKAAGQTFSGQLAIMGSHLQDIEEDIGAAILPALVELAKSLSDLAVIAGPLLKAVFEGLATTIKTFTTDIQYATGAVQQFMTVLPGKQEGEDAAGFWTNLADRAKGAADIVFHLVPGFTAVATSIDAVKEVANSTAKSAKDMSIGLHGAGGGAEFIADRFKEAQAVVVNFAHMSRSALKTFTADAVGSLRDMATGLVNWSSQLTLTGLQTKKAMEGMAGDAKQTAKDYKALDRDAVPEKFKAFLISEGPAAVHGFVTANRGAQKDIVDAWRSMTDSLQSAIQTMKKIASGGGKDVGYNLSTGVMAGIASQAPAVRAAAEQVINEAIAAARAAAKARSPSLRMAELGTDLMQGLQIGVDKARVELIPPDVFTPRGMTRGGFVGAGGGSVDVHIGTLVAGDSQAAAKVIRDELLKLKGSRVSLGLS